VEDAGGAHLRLDRTPRAVVRCVIWVWCGGGIRAAGWQTYLGMNVGSDAASKLDVTVSSIALYFTPITALSGLR
jgi:hypothetical protein